MIDKKYVLINSTMEKTKSRDLKKVESRLEKKKLNLLFQNFGYVFGDINGIVMDSNLSEPSKPSNHFKILEFAYSEKLPDFSKFDGLNSILINDLDLYLRFYIPDSPEIEFLPLVQYSKLSQQIDSYSDLNLELVKGLSSILEIINPESAMKKMLFSYLDELLFKQFKVNLSLVYSANQMGKEVFYVLDNKNLGIMDFSQKGFVDDCETAYLTNSDLIDKLKFNKI